MVRSVLLASTLILADYSTLLTTAGQAGLIITPSSRVANTPYELLITEIYADPTPSIGLPEVEYVEIYNASDRSIELDQLKFENSGSAKRLPTYIMSPNSYAILTDVEDTSTMSIYGATLGMTSFAALNNNGDDLAIVTDGGETIHRVAYDRTWYQDNDRDDGGYALEMINVDDPCALISNWGASASLIGGTPGGPNSIQEPDWIASFEVLNVIPSEGMITITLSKEPDLANDVSIQSDPVLSFELNFVGPNQVVMHLETPLETGRTYELTLDGWLDCRKQSLEQSSFVLTLPELADEGDLLINEILFNPQIGGSDYVEIANASTKNIDLAGIFISNLHEPGSTETIQAGHILAPGELVVFTEDPSDILARYHVPETAKLIRQSLPSFPDKAGNVSIYRVEDAEVITLDAFDYSDQMHLALLRDKNGVSLERISTKLPTNQSATWQSAAETAGFGTPTGVNSQRTDLDDEHQFVLNPRVFSPDGDGVADFMLFQYRFKESGFRTNLRIYDVGGHLVYEWANQELLGSTGSLKWDGTTTDGSKAPLGIYTVLLESYRENGNIIRWKETCVVANQLD